MTRLRFKCPAKARGAAPCSECSGVILGYVDLDRHITIIQKYDDGRFIKGLCIDLIHAKEPGIYPGLLEAADIEVENADKQNPSQDAKGPQSQEEEKEKAEEEKIQ